jgi:hypothetical protein
LLIRTIFLRCANCQEIGYAARRHSGVSPDKESLASCKEKCNSRTNQNGSGSPTGGSKPKSTVKSNKRPRPVDSASEDESFHDTSPSRESDQDPTSNSKVDLPVSMFY